MADERERVRFVLQAKDGGKPIYVRDYLSLGSKQETRDYITSREWMKNFTLLAVFENPTGDPAEVEKKWRARYGQVYKDSATVVSTDAVIAMGTTVKAETPAEDPSAKRDKMIRKGPPPPKRFDPFGPDFVVVSRGTDEHPADNSPFSRITPQPGCNGQSLWRPW